jgi:hypothetical protein
MRGLVLAIASIIVLASGGSHPAVADRERSTSRAGPTAAETETAPEQGVKKPVADRPKDTAKTSPGLERAPRPERQSRILELLWLLAGSSRRR